MSRPVEPQENLDYDDPFESISDDALRRGLTNDQVWEVWQAGLAAQQLRAADGAKMPEIVYCSVENCINAAAYQAENGNLVCNSHAEEGAFYGDSFTPWPPRR